MSGSYTTYEFYMEKYLMGKKEKIPLSDFAYWSGLASAEIRLRTFERVDSLGSVPEEVQLCCCEIAEKLQSLELAKSENGMILQSYSNDGDSGTFRTGDVTESAVRKSVDSICRKYLLHAGLLYRGVK